MSKRDSEKKPNSHAEPPTQDEGQLFAQAMAGVKPLRPDNRVVRQPPAVRPARHARALGGQAMSDPEQPVERLEAGEQSSFRRHSVRPGVLRDLRRGKHPVDGTIDLHGMTARVALGALSEFVEHALRRRDQCLRIVHGKGLRSGADGPVLKGEVHHWLSQHAQVLAFTSARANDGGSGAVIVLLSQRR